MDAAVGLASGLALLKIMGEEVQTQQRKYLLLALMANHGALRLSGIISAFFAMALATL